MLKTVNVQQLKDNHPAEYQKEYERYYTSQWEFPLEEDWYIEGLNEQNKWLDVSGILYSISYSQGDYAQFTGRVYLEKFLDEFDTENEYFVLREAMKMGDCDEYMVVSRSSYYRGGASFDTIEWRGLDEGWFENDTVLGHNGRTTSILEGMNYKDYYDVCQELIGDLEEWVKGKCESLFSKLYDDIRSELEYQSSEEAFVEWAESMDEQFEVEVDDEEYTEEGSPECRGAVSRIDDGRLAA